MLVIQLSSRHPQLEVTLFHIHGANLRQIGCWHSVQKTMVSVPGSAEPQNRLSQCAWGQYNLSSTDIPASASAYMPASLLAVLTQ